MALSDDFNRADAATLGTATSGQVWATPIIAAWAIISNKAGQSAANGSFGAVPIESSASNLQLNCDITLSTVAALAGIFIRNTTGENYVGVFLSTNTGAGDVIQLFKLVAGAQTNLAAVASPGLVLGNTYAVKLQGNGSSLSFEVTGTFSGGASTKSASASDAFNSTATRVGLMGYRFGGFDDGGSRYDNLADAPPPGGAMVPARRRPRAALQAAHRASSWFERCPSGLLVPGVA